MTRFRLLAIIAASALAGSGWLIAADAAAGATQVARWKDGKAGAFMLMFDDSVPSDVKNVVPELTRRHLTGTFYINPAAGHYLAFKDAWEKQIPATGMEYANHTMTHSGARDEANAEEEIGGCTDAIMRIVPSAKPRLISFGRPGVKQGAWNITDAQLAPILARHHLVERPPFGGHGAAINLKTVDDLVRLAEQAQAKGEAQYVVFHGVGGDWITFPLSDFVTFLDRLAPMADKLWIAGAIAVHKYETERDASEVEVLGASADAIRVVLKAKTDPAFYDAPLTLVTRVPTAWKRCAILHGATRTEAVPVDGALRYEALPDGEPIEIARRE
jgi:peptidoglycan/xylan/chitin deacetylase (PgdA/CDA1 family)